MVLPIKKRHIMWSFYHSCTIPWQIFLRRKPDPSSSSRLLTMTGVLGLELQSLAWSLIFSTNTGKCAQFRSASSIRKIWVNRLKSMMLLSRRQYVRIIRLARKSWYFGQRLTMSQACLWVSTDTWNLAVQFCVSVTRFHYSWAMRCIISSSLLVYWITSETTQHILTHTQNWKKIWCNFSATISVATVSRPSISHSRLAGIFKINVLESTGHCALSWPLNFLSALPVLEPTVNEAMAECIDILLEVLRVASDLNLTSWYQV